ncbi:MAG: SRPBCC domain-containing protein [Bacteroidota bacterium]
MKKIVTKILIEARPEQVWQALTNFSEIGSWNPFIKEISGEGSVGAQLKVILQPKPGQEMKFEPEVLVWKENQQFEWLGKLWIKGLFDGNHYFHLEETAEGHTLFHHGERFTGILVGILMAMIGKQTEQNFEAMNAAIKQKAEAMVAST